MSQLLSAKEALISGFDIQRNRFENIGLHVYAARKIPSLSDIWLLSGAIWHEVRDWLTACHEIALLVL